MKEIDTRGDRRFSLDAVEECEALCSILDRAKVPYDVMLEINSRDIGLFKTKIWHEKVIRIHWHHENTLVSSDPDDGLVALLPVVGKPD